MVKTQLTESLVRQKAPHEQVPTHNQEGKNFGAISGFATIKPPFWFFHLHGQQDR